MIKLRTFVVLVLTILLSGYFTGVSICAERETAPKKKKVKYVRAKHGIETMIELSTDRDKMVREFNIDTMNFEKVLKGINDSKIKAGDTDKGIKKQYGEPVVVVPVDNTGELERWVYKPGIGSFFDGNKIYLIFNKDGYLKETKIINAGA